MGLAEQPWLRRANLCSFKALRRYGSFNKSLEATLCFSKTFPICKHRRCELMRAQQGLTIHKTASRRRCEMVTGHLIKCIIRKMSRLVLPLLTSMTDLWHKTICHARLSEWIIFDVCIQTDQLSHTCPCFLDLNWQMWVRLFQLALLRLPFLLSKTPGGHSVQTLRQRSIWSSCSLNRHLGGTAKG